MQEMCMEPRITENGEMKGTQEIGKPHGEDTDEKAKSR